MEKKLMWYHGIEEMVDSVICYVIKSNCKSGCFYKLKYNGRFDTTSSSFLYKKVFSLCFVLHIDLFDLT